VSDTFATYFEKKVEDIVDTMHIDGTRKLTAVNKFFFVLRLEITQLQKFQGF
jgi:hypothetical protein